MTDRLGRTAPRHGGSGAHRRCAGARRGLRLDSLATVLTAKCSRGGSLNCPSSLTASGRIGHQATVGFWLEKAEAEKERVGAWKLRLEMQQARSGNTSTNTAGRYGHRY